MKRKLIRTVPAQRVTVDLLRELNACSEQVILFRRHFQTGAPVTPETVGFARRMGIMTGWLVNTLMTVSPYLRRVRQELEAAYAGQQRAFDKRPDVKRIRAWVQHARAQVHNDNSEAFQVYVTALWALHDAQLKPLMEQWLCPKRSQLVARYLNYMLYIYERQKARKATKGGNR